jgi:diphthamide synthase (EF-2-diphthine--ammonia ligase)
MVFGDLFLEDIRRYREAALENTGITPFFPLWQRPTATVAANLVKSGFRAIVVCVDTAQAPSDIAGRWFDESLVAALPPGVDPCGENGEFHTVVVDGPDFSHPVDVIIGEKVEREGFVFCDVIPAVPK